MEWNKGIRGLARSPQRSIGSKLFLLFFCFVCLSVVSLGLFSSSTAQTAMLSQTKSSSVQTITLAGEKLDMKQRFYLDLADQLIKNNSFTEQLFQFANAATMPAGELQSRVDAVRDLFDQLILSDPQIRDMTLFPLEDAVDPIGTERDLPGWNREEAWVKETIAAEGKPVWFPIQERGYLGNSPKPLFAYGRLIGKNNVGSGDYVLLVQIEATVLEGMIGGVKLSPSAETALFAGDGKPIVSTKGKAGLTSLTIAGGQEASSEIRTGSAGEQDRFLAYRKSPISGWVLAGIAPMGELTEATAKIKTTTYGAVAVSVLLALVVGLWLYRMIGFPLGKLEKLMLQAAEGDLRGRIRHRGRDEIGRVAEAYNRMMERIGELVRSARTTAGEVAASSEEMLDAARQTAGASGEIHQAIEQIAGGAVELAANAEKTSGRVESAGERLGTVLEQQNRMAGSAEDAYESCRLGGGTVEELMRNSALAEERLRQVRERVNELSDCAESIQALLLLMTQMARQTTILSFNASIEANRAGAAGAGFKVIAEEIRRLAGQSNEAIVQAGDLTEAIRSEVRGTVDAMETALPFFGRMAEDVRSVHRHFSDIERNMKQVKERSEAVAAAVRELEQTQFQLAAAAAEVSGVSQEASAASEQVASLWPCRSGSASLCFGFPEA
ncbi:methyl-accepting chemotaxis protein [Cohnella caldifontis]|uniref:methyl-accepting chemotaxis protein n=1 Tax=Cohnella caldifontis TaxID=3027471 RepID=UPI0023EA8B73|nr:methyl-accepting chemotaxis protein [Cohnella sp. YIM B05605]